MAENSEEQQSRNQTKGSELAEQLREEVNAFNSHKLLHFVCVCVHTYPFVMFIIVEWCSENLVVLM